MIYYIACSATERVKIGYTRGEPEVRLKQLQTGSAAELRLVACHGGSVEDERSLHEEFAEYRLRGEWFEMAEPVRRHVSLVIWFVATQIAAEGGEPPLWVKCGLRAMNDGSLTPLPARLASFL
jgi:hypothetical protein